MRCSLRLALIVIWSAGASLAQAQQPGVSPPAAKPTPPPIAAPSPKPAPNADQPPDPKLNEEIVRLPLNVKLRGGATHTGEFVLSTFRPPGPGPFPTVIVSHGRSSSKSKRAEFGRNRLLRDYWTLRGFAVLAPTRIGYGVSGVTVNPESPEGYCDAMNFAPMAAAVSAHIRAAIDYAVTQPWVDKDNILLAGGSVGGFGSIVAAGEKLPGVTAIVNFAGGTGGWIEKRAEQPCSPKNVEMQFIAAARRAPLPGIWFYSENDRYWGSRIPRQWHAAYVEAGGRAEFHMLPPFGEDGHDVVALGGEHWRPLLDRFLTSIGYGPRKLPPGAPQPTGFAALDDVAAVPLVSQQCREIYATFLKKDVPRAFAIGRNGSCAYYFGQQDVMAKSLARCLDYDKRPCRLYAINDEVVWQP